jgi:uncharacterized protein (TIGR03435 family)
VAHSVRLRYFRDVFGIRKKLSLGAAAFAIVPLTASSLDVAFAARSHAQSQPQNSSAIKFEYDVVSVKPSNPGNGGRGSPPPFPDVQPPDGFNATNASLMLLIRTAFGTFEEYRLSGAPNWISSEQFDINAKMDGPIADALQKLSPDDRELARQQMLQALLADRFRLTFHRDFKEFSNYSLVVAKNGPKLHEAKPGDTYANGAKGLDGLPIGSGAIRMSREIEGPQSITIHLTGQAVLLAKLAQFLTRVTGRPVVDKTGLTGAYDFTVRFSPDDSQLQASPAGAPNGAPPAPPDNGPLFAAIQQQLGLKLEPGKGPVEVIVIDHVERPSGN